MKQYECTCIIKPDRDEDTEKIIENIKDIIDKSNGKVNDIDEWGLRKLAYPVKNYKEGYYVVFDLSFETDDVKTFKSQLQKESDIIRYLIVKNEGEENA